MLAFMACAESLRRFDTKTPRGDEDNMGQDGTGQIGDLGLVCLKYGIFSTRKKLGRFGCVRLSPFESVVVVDGSRMDLDRSGSPCAWWKVP